MKPYKDGAPSYDIIEDGFMRSFNIQQTLDELKIMGYDISREYVQSEWDRYEKDMAEDFADMEILDLKESQ